MTNHKWDLKSNYMLAFAADKYGLESDQWALIAKDLTDFIETTPENCQTQFEHLCRQYGQDWPSTSKETRHAYLFSVVKRLYYSDLCERMNESRNLLMVMYDFIRLYKGGRLTIDDVNAILQDLRSSSTSNFNDGPDRERQEKIKLLQRLKSLLAEKVPDAINEQEIYSFPMELFAPPPPPPFFPSIPLLVKYDLPTGSNESTSNYSSEKSLANGHYGPGTISVHPMTEEKPVVSSSTMPEINGEDHEIELSSGDDEDDDDDDDGDGDTTAHDQTIQDAGDSSVNKSITDSNMIGDQDESNDALSNEPMETNESSNLPPVTNEVSTSDDRETDDYVSISNPSTVDTGSSTNERGTSNINGDMPTSSSLQANISVTNSSDHVTSDSNPVPSVQEPFYHETESVVETTTRVVTIEDDEAARMDAEQTPEHVPVDVEDIPVPNDNAVFVVDELMSGNHNGHVHSPEKMEETIPSTHDNGVLTEIHDNEESPAKRRRTNNHSSRLNNSSLSQNFRKSVTTILNNLKNAKYGPDFSKSLKSFKLQDDYYNRIKNPIDIPEIRQRMTNGDYDDNILLFERDVLLMLTNALCNYHRHDNIHGHAREMMDYALELFMPLEETYTPWQTLNGFETHDNHHSDDGNANGNGNDSDDHESRTRTPSIASTSSSIRTNSSAKHHRSQATSTHTMQKRQRKTFHSF